MIEPIESFGYWVRRRRKVLDLTQQALADQVGCSVAAIKKIETDQRQPSRQLAERLADYLHVSPAERATFLALARGAVLPEGFAPSFAPATTSPTQPAPLPMEASPFIGRSDELQQIAAYLADPSCRLLSLVGTGGIGKTRLALRAVEQAQFAHGVCFVPLADVSAPALVVPAIVLHLGLHTAGSGDGEHGLISFLHRRELLLVLDNFEHLLADDQIAVDAPVALLGRILNTCPRVKLLVTSRERLNMQAEWLLPIAGLPLEDAAIPLFVERAAGTTLVCASGASSGGRRDLSAGGRDAAGDRACSELDPGVFVQADRPTASAQHGPAHYAAARRAGAPPQLPCAVRWIVAASNAG